MSELAVEEMVGTGRLLAVSWERSELVSVLDDWLQIVSRAECAGQARRAYAGDSDLMEGRLEVALAAARSAECYARRAIWHRAVQLGGGVGLP